MRLIRTIIMFHSSNLLWENVLTRLRCWPCRTSCIDPFLENELLFKVLPTFDPGKMKLLRKSAYLVFVCHTFERVREKKLQKNWTEKTSMLLSPNQPNAFTAFIIHIHVRATKIMQISILLLMCIINKNCEQSFRDLRLRFTFSI